MTRLVLRILLMPCTHALISSLWRFLVLPQLQLPLLEFSVKQGWAPLCEFLGVLVPDVPFPKATSSQEVNAMHARYMCGFEPSVPAPRLQYSTNIFNGDR